MITILLGKRGDIVIQNASAVVTEAPVLFQQMLHSSAVNISPDDSKAQDPFDLLSGLIEAMKKNSSFHNFNSDFTS